MNIVTQDRLGETPAACWREGRGGAPWTQFRLPLSRMAGTRSVRRKTRPVWSVPWFADLVNVIVRNATRLGCYRLGHRLPYPWGAWCVSPKRVLGSEVLFCPFGYRPG